MQIVTAEKARELILAGNAPEGLYVHNPDGFTNLDLSNQSELTSLPDDLHVIGNLNLSGCVNLQELPKNLVVGILNKPIPTSLPIQGFQRYDLDLTECTALIGLPENLRVDGEITMKQCTLLSDVPANIQAHALYFSDCPALTTIPFSEPIGISINELSFINCDNLVHLPKFLFLQKLVVNNCSNLVEFPETVSVRGGCLVVNCTQLQHMPKRITVKQNPHKQDGILYLRNCPKVTNLENIEVHYLHIGEGMALDEIPNNGQFKYMKLEDCDWLTHLPNNLDLGHLVLRNCHNIAKLPVDLKTGHLYLHNCTGLTELPSNLMIRGEITIEDCTSLRKLPPNIKDDRSERISDDDFIVIACCKNLEEISSNEYIHNLFIHNCPSLKKLPDNLEVGEGLDLINCTGLIELPKGLSVGWHLNLRGCTNLTKLPDDLQVGISKVGNFSEMDIGETGITEIPESLSHVQLIDTSDYILEPCKNE